MGRIVLILIIAVVTVFTSCSKEKEIRIFCIGDSTMANKKTKVYPETGWCQVLDLYFDNTVQIKNHAVNGRSSKSFIDEGRWKSVLDSLQKGDYVFIQFGHNDQKEYDSTRYTTPYGTYSDNLKKFVNESRSKKAKPVLFTSIVRRHFDKNGTLIDTHGDYPEACRDLANEMNVPLIDLQKLTEEMINETGENNSKEIYVWTAPNNEYPDGRKDNTHLSEKGAKIVAQIALEESKKLNLEFSKRLK